MVTEQDDAFILAAKLPVNGAEAYEFGLLGDRTVSVTIAFADETLDCRREDGGFVRRVSRLSLCLNAIWLSNFGACYLCCVRCRSDLRCDALQQSDIV